jgi:hypothetical protein
VRKRTRLHRPVLKPIAKAPPQLFTFEWTAAAGLERALKFDEGSTKALRPGP